MLTTMLISQAYCSEAEDVFSYIYKNQIWGPGSDELGSSGGGSTLELTTAYRLLLQDFMSNNTIHSVVDAGCGDWGFSRVINWEGIDYLGLDVVPDLIAINQKKYAGPHIRFLQADVCSIELPCADLLICKDVLQHLSNEDIWAFIRQLPNFKYCLITNDPGDNSPIERGGYRGVDLTKPPFFLKGEKILFYTSDQHIKEVLLITREDQ